MLPPIVFGDVTIPLPALVLMVSVLFGGTATVVSRARGISVPAAFPIRLLWSLALAIVLGIAQLAGSLLLTALAAAIGLPYPPLIKVEDCLRVFCSAAWEALTRWTIGKQN